MNVTLAVLNILVIFVVAAVFLVPRVREYRETKADIPNGIRPNRPGQELADAVTEWAKVTGVLSEDGTADPSRAPDIGNLGPELSEDRA